MKVELEEGATLLKGHRSDAGYDLISRDTVTIMPGESQLIGTGVRVEIPPGNFGLLTHRSSLPLKYGCQIMTGIIDSGYRGEIKMNVHNMSRHDEVTIVRNQRIGQLIVIPYYEGPAVIGAVASDTSRGEGGFGSTDLKPKAYKLEKDPELNITLGEGGFANDD